MPGRNKFEKSGFDFLRKHKVKFSYETTKIPYVIKGNYIPDFIVETSKGLVFIEFKGHFRPEAKRKMSAVKKQHPELDIRFVFYSNKKSDVRWALKHGFKFAFRTIPQDWIEEFNDQ